VLPIYLVFAIMTSSGISVSLFCISFLVFGVYKDAFHGTSKTVWKKSVTVIYNEHRHKK
jgi:hypothetical protein